MTKKEPVTPAFGAFLSNETIAQATMMSTRTYNLLKKG